MSFGPILAASITAISVHIAVRVVSSRRGRDALAEGQPDVRKGAAAARAGDWTEFERLYSKRSASDRYHFLRCVAEQGKLDAGTPSATSATSAAIAAGLRLGWAWRHRGSGVGASVSERGAENMFRLLQEAADILDSQQQLDSVGCALRIRIEMGLEGSRGVLEKELKAAAALEERNIYVPMSHLMFIAPKWHGSAEEILELARDYAAVSTHPAWKALPAMAHAENWLYRSAMSDSPEDKTFARDYYLGAEFATEVVVIDDEFWRARAAAAAPMAHAELVFAHNQLAYLFYRIGMRGRLARHVEQIRRDLTAIPWGYAGLLIEQGGTLRAVRRQAGLRG